MASPCGSWGGGRSNLVSEELEQAKQGNVLTRTTLSLFYATDFFDQLVNEIIPALRAGLIVIADRYIYTLMARDSVRGADRGWLQNLYGPALVPDAVFYFRVSARAAGGAEFPEKFDARYWRAGWIWVSAGTCLIRSTSTSGLLQLEFQRLQKAYKF